MRPTLLALLAAAVLFAPLAAAGSDANPETGDDANDDVEVNGASCGLPASPPPNPHGCLWSPDFVWANVDIDWAWVNDTAEDLLITLEMKAGTAYAPDAGLAGSLAEASPFVYTYTFTFTANGTTHTAIAIMGQDGVFTLGGVATDFTVHDGNDLTVRIPKASIGATANGTIIGGLAVSAHGQSDDGMTLDDAAPDGATSRDYAIANSTATPGNATAQTSGCANPGSSGGSLVGGNSSSSASSAPCPSASTTSTTGSATSSAAPVGAKADTPAPGVLLSLVAVAAVAALVRRRL